ncbi:MAG: hypothetical protein ACJ74Y_03385 [Bryobacteraceae bacterium]
MVLRAAVLSLLPLICFPASKKNQKAEESRPNPAAATPQSATLASCPAGSPLGAMELQVASGKNRPLPFLNFVHLTEGDVVRYSPLDRGRDKRGGEVSLVLVPTKISGTDELIITDARDASKPQEWTIPQTIALAVFVYGPQGLSKKKVKSFLSQDDSLVAQLAEYADKTAQTEALISALSNASSSSASVNAALSGFASQYGVSVQLDKNAPPAAQAQALFSAMNPQLSNYNPVPGSSAAIAGQTASLATAAASLFFGSPVGLLAGGTSMLLGLRSMAFPDTQFRSSFPQQMGGTALNLCADRGTTPPHTRIAFIWASRIPNAGKPKIEVRGANFIPAGQKSPVTVAMADRDWRFLQRARDWYLAGPGEERGNVSVLKLENQKALEIDLTKAHLGPGEYHLGAYWDWAQFDAEGAIHVVPLSDLSAARLQPESQDRLVAKSGKIPVTLSGSDFEFATKVQIKKSGDEFALPQDVRFILPKGLREGPQNHMDVQIDAANLDAGAYQLLLQQQGGTVGSIPITILPNPPKLTNLPIIANQGAGTQHYVLKGERLGEILRVEAQTATVDLGATSAAETERNVTVQLAENASSEKPQAIKVYLKNRIAPLTFADGIAISGPLPVIISSKLAAPTSQGVALRPSEFPVGATLSGMLDVKNIARTSSLKLDCAAGNWESASLTIGRETPTWSLQQISPDQLFLSYDTETIPAPCELEGQIENGKDGRSTPFALVKLVRLPRIESITFASETQPAAQAGLTGFYLEGRNLEMIARVGWDSAAPADINSLPTPIVGEGQRQRLSVPLPQPSDPSSTLTVWLRGDTEGRTTSVKYESPVAVPH